MARGFETTDPRRVGSLYILVLREALSCGDLRHLNWGVLVDVWPDLRIPDRVRDLWEIPFPGLTGNPGLWGRG